MTELKFHKYNLHKHNVSEEEVYECFDDSAQILQKAKDGTYVMIAKTLQNDLLHIVFRWLSAKTIYVFHARSVNQVERKRYKRKGK